MVKQGVSNAPYDKTRRGVVKAVDTDTQTYTVSIDGVLYHNVKPLSGSSVRAGDVVNVIYPTNNPSQMMIYGVTDMTQSEIEEFVLSLGLHGRTICPYDVGDIYETTNSANPSTKWDGTTWNLVSEAADYIVEEGTSDIWTYRKWASGVVDMWGVSTGSEASYGSVLLGYWYPHYRLITFPFSIKNVSASYSVLCGSGWAIPGANFPYSHNDSSDGITSSNIYSLASTSGTISVTYKIIVHGLWKTRETPQTIYKWRRLS